MLRDTVFLGSTLLCPQTILAVIGVSTGVRVNVAFTPSETDSTRRESQPSFAFSIPPIH